MSFYSEGSSDLESSRLDDSMARGLARARARQMMAEDQPADDFRPVDSRVDVQEDDEVVDDAESEDEDAEPPMTPPHFDEEEAYRDGLNQLEGLGLVDIGGRATWTASSSKPGFGMKELREDVPGRFWQSDGQQPHFITVHFTKKVSIERLCLFLNYEADESYTPSKILILAGSGDHDLVEVASREFSEPSGWQDVFFDGVRFDDVLKCHLLKICFLSNHQNGKDSHVRAIKVLTTQTLQDKPPSMQMDDEVGFTSVRFKSESTIR